MVDDDPAVRDVAVRFLTGHGYQALTAASGEEALDIYRKQGAAIDLVVLDLSMPGMGGHACLQRLLALDPKARVLIASGYSPGRRDSRHGKAGRRVVRDQALPGRRAAGPGAPSAGGGRRVADRFPAGKACLHLPSLILVTCYALRNLP